MNSAGQQLTGCYAHDESEDGSDEMMNTANVYGEAHEVEFLGFLIATALDRLAPEVFLSR